MVEAGNVEGVGDAACRGKREKEKGLVSMCMKGRWCFYRGEGFEGFVVGLCDNTRTTVRVASCGYEKDIGEALLDISIAVERCF